MWVYTIGRSNLLDLFHAELQSDQVRIVEGPATRRVTSRHQKCSMTPVSIVLPIVGVTEIL